MSAVASLVEQSLVRTDVHAEHGVRFGMLGTIRQFAWVNRTGFFGGSVS